MRWRDGDQINIVLGEMIPWESATGAFIRFSLSDSSWGESERVSVFAFFSHSPIIGIASDPLVLPILLLNLKIAFFCLTKGGVELNEYKE